MTVALLVAGLLLLVVGAELLVRGASRLALALGIAPLVVGLTVVAFGTSAPELGVSASAALGGRPDIAIGNVVGSNIFNVLLILGLSALVRPLFVSARLIRLDVPIMITVSGIMLLFAWNGTVGRGEGAFLLVCLVAYLLLQFRHEAEADSPASAALEAPAGEEPGRGPARSLPRDLLLIAFGLGCLVLGSRWFVEGAREIALRMGVTELLVGLTVVAAGTSLPELFTSVVAALRGERDIAVGNIVGSNIFNVLAILGVAAAISPDGLVASPAATTFDIPVMTVVALVCLPVFFQGEIARWEGALFLGYYVAYTVYLALDATDHGAFPEFREAMAYFVLPLTLLTLVTVALAGRRRSASEG